MLEKKTIFRNFNWFLQKRIVNNIEFIRAKPSFHFNLIITYIIIKYVLLDA